MAALAANIRLEEENKIKEEGICVLYKLTYRVIFV